MIAAIVCVGYGGLSLAWKPFNDETANYWLRVLVWFAPGFALFNYILGYLTAAKRGAERAGLVFQQRLTFFACIVGGAVWLDWPGVVAGYLIFLGGFAVYLLWRYRVALFAKPAAYPYRAVLAYTFWDSMGFIPPAAAPFLLLALSERLLGDVRLVSQLSIALTFSVLAKVVFAAINDLMFPYLMEKESRRAFIVLLGKIVLFDAVLALGVVVVSYGIIPPLITLVLGERYAESLPVFRVVILGEIIVAYSVLFERVLQVLSALRFRAAGLFAALAFYAWVLSLLIPDQGLGGAAIGFLAFAGFRALVMGVGAMGFIRRGHWPLILPSTGEDKDFQGEN